MSSALFSLTPTFTQGLVIGQISILLLLAAILKYLFLETEARSAPLYPPRVAPSQRSNGSPTSQGKTFDASPETAEWFNLILQYIAQAYRTELKSGLTGPAGDEAARARVERWINKRVGTALLDTLHVHGIDIGTASPSLVKAQIIPPDKTCNIPRIECDINYHDDISASLSTSLLFNYPTPSFARLPVALTVSSIDFSAKITVTPPLPSDPTPCLTLTLDPGFTLDIQANSLLGSRAKLADVPKIHSIIQQRIRSLLATRGTWKLVLPGVHAKDVVEMLEKKR